MSGINLRPLGLIVTEVILLPGLSLEIAVWTPVSLIYSRLVPWVVYDRKGVGFLSRLL